MSEVQSHGISFENFIIQQRTGITKKEYDNLKSKGYISKFDLCSGIITDYDASIKTTGGKTICCADLLSMINHTHDYRMIVGCYNQVGKNKQFHTQYEFFISSQDYRTLWGDMNYKDVETYVNRIKSIPHGKQAQLEYQFIAESLKSEIIKDNCLFIVNPKVDSKKQRRVQCSIHLDKLIDSGVKYIKSDLNITIISSRRKFNKCVPSVHPKTHQIRTL
jgi:hypothetical protein